jgi:hypothetical protein
MGAWVLLFPALGIVVALAAIYVGVNPPKRFKNPRGRSGCQRTERGKL